MKQNKSILIASKCTYFFSNPSNISIIEYLLERNINIFLIMPNQVYPYLFKSKISYINHEFDYNFFKFQLIFKKIKSIILNFTSIRFIINQLKDIFELLNDTFKKLIFLNNIKYKSNEIDIAIIDDTPVSIFDTLNKFIQFNNKIFISYEIWFPQELSGNSLEIFNLAKKRFKLFNKIIVQDCAREKILLNTKDVTSKDVNVNYLPVAYSYNSSSEDKIFQGKILISGSLDLYTGVDQLLRTIKSDAFLNQFTFNFQTHRINTTNPLILSLLEDSSSKNVFIEKNNFINYKHYLRYISSFDIGISLYFPHQHDDISIELGENLSEIGLSSGKMAAYLACGLPVIFSHTNLLSELNKKYEFGIMINNVSELGFAINEIQYKYKMYSQNALNFYRSELKPNKFLRKIFSA